MRIAIVNDVRTTVEALRRVLAGVSACELAWVAADGAEAVKKCLEDPPDLILMDLIMPVMDGVEATRRIMAERPCSILIVTATVEGNSSKVFEALGAGALDVVKTPKLGTNGQSEGAAELRFKIDALYRMASGDDAQRPGTSGGTERQISPGPPDRLVAIGASAGGPAALATILGTLSAHYPAAVVIVQHVDVEFAAPMADWLNNKSALPVHVIREGHPLEEGSALVAATNDHLILRNSGTLGYVSEPRDSHYRPSVDVFFESVSRHWKGEVVGVLLTGMGRDGAKGLLTLRKGGALTIAQDHGSCVVYGMPKAAAELGAAAEILPLDRIGPRLTALANRTRSRQ